MEVTRLVDRIGCVDVATASAGELASLMADVGRMKGWVTGVEAAAARRASELEDAGEVASAVDLISRGTKASRRAADKARRRGVALGSTPELSRQLERGRVTSEHADALASAAAQLDDHQRSALFGRDADLAVRAGAETPAQFARTLAREVAAICLDDGVERSELQRRSANLSHGIDADTGMGWIRADLHPDDYQKVKRRLDAETNAMRHLTGNETARYEQLAATALVDLITGGRAVARVPAEVVVLLDHQTLVDGVHAETVCEYDDGTPVPADTARRHACDATIIPAVLDSTGMPLDVGRGKRHATPAQRHALRVMHRTCAVGGCDAGFDRCEIHHLVEWANLGTTDLRNLVPICSYHHHRAHEGRWRLQLDPSTRRLDVFLPDGTLHSRAVPDTIGERRPRDAA